MNLQNGVAERKNQTLVEMVRCMMLQSGLPPSFWAESILTAKIHKQSPVPKRNTAQLVDWKDTNTHISKSIWNRSIYVGQAIWKR